MKMLDIINKDAVKIQHTFMYRLSSDVIRTYDIDEALTDPKYALYFTMRFIGMISNHEFGQLEDVACKAPNTAYYWAKKLHGANIAKCQNAVLSSEPWSMLFIRYVPNADKEKHNRLYGKP